jgi:hypothetical protein
MRCLDSLVDAILALNSTAETKALKNLLGVPNVTHIQDVVSLLTYPLGAWQAKNWDPAVSSTGFDDFCHDLLGKSAKAEYAPMSSESQHPLFQAQESQEEGSPTFYLSNYARYIREGVTPFCKEHDQDACFGTFDAKGYQKHSLKETWRSWTWQYCTGASSSSAFEVCLLLADTLCTIRMGLPAIGTSSRRP